MSEESLREATIDRLIELLQICPNVDATNKCWTWWQHTYCKSLMELIFDLNQDEWGKENMMFSPAKKLADEQRKLQQGIDLENTTTYNNQV